MPNPIFNVQRSVSKRAPKRQIPMPPVLEDYEGDNNPYRGIESHGVEPTAKPTDVEADWDSTGERLVHYEIDPPEADPIAVRVVTGDGPEQRRVFRTQKVILPLDGTPVRVVGLMPGRKSVQIRAMTNTANAPAYIGPDVMSVSNGGMNAWIMQNNEILNLTVEGEIWAAAAVTGSALDLANFATTDVRLNVLIEYPVEI